MAAFTALLPSVLANNQATNGNNSATDSKSTVETKNLMGDTPTSFIEFNGSDQYMVIPHSSYPDLTVALFFTRFTTKRASLARTFRFTQHETVNDSEVVTLKSA